MTNSDVEPSSLAPARDAGGRPHPGLLRTLRVRDLVLVNVLAVLSLRWITRAATAGAASLVLWLLAFGLFALPLASSVARLSRLFPEEGGLYVWTRRAFGPLHGFVCGWSWWICNIVYFPALLLFAAPNMLTVFGEPARALAANRAYGVVFAFAGLLFSLGLATVGWRASRRWNLLGGVALWAPVVLLVAAGGFALATRGSATSFTRETLLPSGSLGALLGLWSSMCFAFAGFEVTGVVAGEVVAPERDIPRGLLVSSAMIAAAYVLATTSLLVVLPARDLSEQTGIADALTFVGRELALSVYEGLAGLAVGVGLVASTTVWFGAAGRVPFAVGIDRMLPRSLAQLHPRYKTPHVALVVQATIAALLLLGSLFFTVTGAANSLQEAYDILVGIAVITNFIPYLYVFAAVWRLDRTPVAGSTGPLPAGWAHTGATALAALGFATTTIAIALTMVPPPGVRQPANYLWALVLQTMVLLGIGLAFYLRAPRDGSPSL